MGRISRYQLCFPIGLLLMLFLDGTISQLFGSVLFAYPYAAVSHLTVLWLVSGVLFSQQPTRMIEIYAIIAGVIFDSYYTGVLGLFVFIFPLIVMATRSMMRYLNLNFWTDFLVYFIDIAMVEALAFIGSKAIHMADTSISQFLAFTLGPTILLNILCFAILYCPLGRLFTLMQKRRGGK